MHNARKSTGLLQSARVTSARHPWLCVLAFGLVQACSGATSAGRYPEKKRPEPARSASDGEILGAQGQSPEDTLEASLTNEHAAPNPRKEDHDERAGDSEPCAERQPAGTAGMAPAETGTGKARRRCRPDPR